MGPLEILLVSWQCLSTPNSCPSDMDSSPHLNGRVFSAASWKLSTRDPPTTTWNSKERKHCPIPLGSMYGIFTYIWLIFWGSTLNFLGLNTSPSVIHCQFLRFSTKIPLQRLVPLGALPLIGVDRSGGIKQSYLESLHGIVFQ